MLLLFWGSVINNLPANIRATGDAGLNPGSGRSLGEGNGNPLRYSCLGHPMDTGARRAIVHGVTKELDTTERVHMHTLAFVETTKKGDSGPGTNGGSRVQTERCSWWQVRSTHLCCRARWRGRQRRHRDLSGWVSVKRCCGSFRGKKRKKKNCRAMELLSRNPHLLASEVWLLMLSPTWFLRCDTSRAIFQKLQRATSPGSRVRTRSLAPGDAAKGAAMSREEMEPSSSYPPPYALLPRNGSSPSLSVPSLMLTSRGSPHRTHNPQPCTTPELPPHPGKTPLPSKAHWSPCSMHNALHLGVCFATTFWITLAFRLLYYKHLCNHASRLIWRMWQRDGQISPTGNKNPVFEDKYVLRNS